MFSASLLIAALAGTFSCGGDDATAPAPPPPPPAPPAAVGSMPDQAVEAGSSVTVDASGYFRDPNGDALTYAASSSDGRVAEATVSTSSVMVTGVGPGTATVTVTATDPGGLSGTQGFGVVVSGSVEDEFDSPASLDDWASANAEATVADGALNLTNQTQGRLGIAERREMPAVSEWTIMARMGRTARRASPGVVSLTRHGRFTAVRLVLRTLDDDDDRDRDRAADTAADTRNYEFAVFDGAAGEWVLVTNLSGGSGSVLETPGEFTDIALGHEGGDFVAYAGESEAGAELFRFDLATSRVDGVGLGEIVSDVTGVWLVNQADPGLTAQHDRVRITGTGSDATPPDAAAIAEAPDAATRSISVSGPDADRAVLVALYEATDGPNWRNNENWLTDAPLGDWYGVDTDDEGRVGGIDLSGEWGQELVPHGLAGPIPPQLGDLTSLTLLNLSVNDLTGGIPPELGNLTQLRWLILAANELSGTIPTDLGNLGNLKNLWLSWNKLSGPIPADLGGLANLEVLHSIQNDLTGRIPPELGNLRNLRSLWLQFNEFSGPIPPEFGNLVNLEELDLLGLDLSGPIPPELGSLTNLVQMQLAGNDLTGSIPPELGNLRNAKSLWLSNNNLTGEIPSELGDLTNLMSLHLGENHLTGEIPPEIGSLSHLEHLDLRGNRDLTGEIPPELGNLARLRVLILWGNDLTGGLPAWLGSLNDLRNLAIGYTRITGGIPPELGNLNSLLGLQLSANSLTGTIPPELGDLISLTTLRLDDNNLTGRLPKSFLQLLLTQFWWHNNPNLCAPDTSEFRRWTAMIEEHQPGPFCSSSAPPASLRTAMDEPTPIPPKTWRPDHLSRDQYDANSDGWSPMIPPPLGNINWKTRLRRGGDPS